MIDFEFLKQIKLKFINGIIQEDDMFGILLFAQSSHIYIYPKKLYHYRIRPDSTMNYDNNFQAKVAGFFKENSKIFKDDYIKRQYHKASSFMQTSLALHTFLENLKDEQTKHIISKCLMPTYVFLAHKILYFSKDPLNLIPEFHKLQKYLQNFEDRTHIDQFFQENLIYKLGNASLNLFKKPKKIASVKLLIQMIQNDKEMQKAYKENVEKYQLDLPNFTNLANQISAPKLKQHLSYKLGNSIFKAYKARFLGGYLWLPFNLIWAFVSFKVKNFRHKKNLTVHLADSLNTKYRSFKLGILEY